MHFKLLFLVFLFTFGVDLSLSFGSDNIRSLDPAHLQKHVEHARRKLKQRIAQERENEISGYIMQAGEAGYETFGTGRLTDRTIANDRAAKIMLEGLLSCAKGLQKKHPHLSLKRIVKEIIGYKFQVDGLCVSKDNTTCDYNMRKYYSFDGSCNNPHHPEWGTVNSQFFRLGEADYSDGVHGIKKASDGSELPSPRKISAKCYKSDHFKNMYLNTFFVFFGQFYTHDIELQKNDNDLQSGPIQTCLEGGTGPVPKEKMHRSGLPIIVPDDDEVYSKFGVKCIPFVRSVVAPNPDCTFGEANQINTVTPWIDLSQVYGNSKDANAALRTFTKGLMKVNQFANRDFPPNLEKGTCPARAPGEKAPCFQTGDIRSNQTPGLQIFHLLFLREHNRIAKLLNLINPLCNDETIFQVARRINIAQYQHIIFNEYVSVLLGNTFRKRLFASTDSYGHTHNYDPEVKGMVANEFSLFNRAQHSMVADFLNFRDKFDHLTKQMKLSDTTGRMYLLQESSQSVDDLIRGLLYDLCFNVDKFVTPEIHQNLFKSNTSNIGVDLLAIDIMRARDHGMPSYIELRKILRLSPVNSFQDLIPLIGIKNVELLRSVYGCIEDVEMYPTILLERPRLGELMGPTLMKAYKDHFERQMVGDYRFYSHFNAYAFNPDQLREISKATMARIICDNTGIRKIPRNPFNAVSKSNPEIWCGTLPRLDITKWILKCD